LKENNFNYHNSLRDKFLSTSKLRLTVVLTLFQCLLSSVIIDSCFKSLTKGIKIDHLLIYSVIPKKVLHFLSKILIGWRPCLIFFTKSYISFKSMLSHVNFKNRSNWSWHFLICSHNFFIHPTSVSTAYIIFKHPLVYLSLNLNISYLYWNVCNVCFSFEILWYI
jgi:hypothetical protein